MNHPLENYRIIADSRFIFSVEDNLYIHRYSELCNNGGDFEVTRERENDRLKIVGTDIWGEGFIGYETLKSYFKSEYDKLEVEARSKIENFMLLNLDEKKQKVFLKNIIAELQVLQNEISKFSLKPKYEECRSVLLESIAAFSKILQNTYYLRNYFSNSPANKIKWLATRNILTTLFIDLIKKGYMEEPKDRIELAHIIFNNFTIANDENFSFDTIYTNVKKSKEKEKRAKHLIDIKPYPNSG